MNEVVDVKNFIRSTRDSGYRNLALALAELIDNSVQAGATVVEITIPSDTQAEADRAISVLDDGCGMDRTTLFKSLAFGGSSRYDNRTGLGRFGMGLPNSSLSQARRLEVYTWTKKSSICAASLDLDGVLAMANPSLEEIVTLDPVHSIRRRTRSGTLIRWLRLDRTLPKSWARESERLHLALGRIFRHLIVEGLTIRIDGVTVPPYDPLMLASPSEEPFGRAYGDPLIIDVSEAIDVPRNLARVTVCFSELDVLRLSHLSAAEKRMLGIVGGAGVSVVRAEREIDYRWTFLSKRKENYDEWWRCEISFAPVLDEAFGVTNTKQGIRPSERLRAILTPQITGIARTLNARARAAHAVVAAQKKLPDEKAVRHVARVIDENSGWSGGSQWTTPTSFRLESRPLTSTQFLEIYEDDGVKRVVLNQNHPFYQVFYRPLTSGTLSSAETMQCLDLLLLALGYSRSDDGPDLDTLLRLLFRSLR